MLPWLLVAMQVSLAGPETGAAVTIASPSDGDKVGWQQMIRGTTTLKDAKLWIVVRPIPAVRFWVQAPATVDANGNWSNVSFFGEKSEAFRGLDFEIMVVANPEKELSEGLELERWPQAEARSATLKVKRQ